MKAVHKYVIRFVRASERERERETTNVDGLICERGLLLGTGVLRSHAMSPSSRFTASEKQFVPYKTGRPISEVGGREWPRERIQAENSMVAPLRVMR